MICRRPPIASQVANTTLNTIGHFSLTKTFGKSIWNEFIQENQPYSVVSVEGLLLPVGCESWPIEWERHKSRAYSSGVNLIAEELNVLSSLNSDDNVDRLAVSEK